MCFSTPDRYLKQTCERCGASYITHQPGDVLFDVVRRCSSCGHNDFVYDFFNRPRPQTLWERVRKFFH